MLKGLFAMRYKLLEEEQHSPIAGGALGKGAQACVCACIWQLSCSRLFV